jgi:DNA-binding MarR family transcriptional regulator
LKIVEANDGLQTTDLIHKMKNSSSVYRLIAEAERLKYIYREPEQIKNKGTTRKRIFITEEGRRIVAVMKKLGLA